MAPRLTPCSGPPDSPGLDFCGRPGQLNMRVACHHCDLVEYACSGAHVGGVWAGIQGHMVLAHPAQVPELVCAIASSEQRTAELYAAEERKPEVYGKAAAAVRALRAGGRRSA